MLSPCQRVSNDSSVAMLAVTAGAVRSRPTRSVTSALKTLLINGNYFCVFK